MRREEVFNLKTQRWSLQPVSGCQDQLETGFSSALHLDQPGAQRDGDKSLGQTHRENTFLLIF